MNLSDIKPNTFPKDLLQDCESGLCLFGAGFYGANDAIHMFKAGMRDVTIMDTDRQKIAAMVKMYPHEWYFLGHDVFDWLESIVDYYKDPYLWDIVVVDPPLSLIHDVCANLDKFLALASKYLVLTVSSMHTHDNLHTRPDWRIQSWILRNKDPQTHLVVWERY